jgi:hypothetical protein
VEIVIIEMVPLIVRADENACPPLNCRERLAPMPSHNAQDFRAQTPGTLA